jgi:hypothetical protein
VIAQRPITASAITPRTATDTWNHSPATLHGAVLALAAPTALPTKMPSTRPWMKTPEAIVQRSESEDAARACVPTWPRSAVSVTFIPTQPRRLMKRDGASATMPYVSERHDATGGVGGDERKGVWIMARVAKVAHSGRRSRRVGVV